MISIFVRNIKNPFGIYQNGSIISVVGKNTVEIIELFECTQKVP